MGGFIISIRVFTHLGGLFGWVYIDRRLCLPAVALLLATISSENFSARSLAYSLHSTLPTHVNLSGWPGQTRTRHNPVPIPAARWLPIQSDLGWLWDGVGWGGSSGGQREANVGQNPFFHSFDQVNWIGINRMRYPGADRPSNSIKKINKTTNPKAVRWQEKKKKKTTKGGVPLSLLHDSLRIHSSRTAYSKWTRFESAVANQESRVRLDGDRCCWRHTRTGDQRQSIDLGFFIGHVDNRHQSMPPDSESNQLSCQHKASSSSNDSCHCLPHLLFSLFLLVTLAQVAKKNH